MAIIYPTGGVQVDYPSFPASEVRPAGNNWLRRFLVALMEARMRQAEREIARYRHLIPTELEMSGNRLTARNEDELPFGR